MPILFCSLKLSKLIGLKTRLPSLSPDNWNAHLFALQGRKCLVFVHKETRYSFVIFDVLKKQLTGFGRLFTESFIQQLKHDRLFSDELADLINEDLENFELSTTDGDKSAIGYMNDCIARLTWGRDGRPPTIAQTKNYVENYYNDYPIIAKKGITPIELMAARLKEKI